MKFLMYKKCVRKKSLTNGDKDLYILKIPALKEIALEVVTVSLIMIWMQN